MIDTVIGSLRVPDGWTMLMSADRRPLALVHNKVNYRVIWGDADNPEITVMKISMEALRRHAEIGFLEFWDGDGTVH